jgi:hypothetical protein
VKFVQINGLVCALLLPLQLTEQFSLTAESTAFLLFVYQLFSSTFAQLQKKSKSYKAHGTF